MEEFKIVRERDQLVEHMAFVIASNDSTLRGFMARNYRELGGMFDYISWEAVSQVAVLIEDVAQKYADQCIAAHVLESEARREFNRDIEDMFGGMGDDPDQLELRSKPSGNGTSTS